MRTFRLNKTLWLSQPRPKIFEFFANPHNLDRLTPPWLKFQLLSPLSTVIRAGTLLHYRLRLHGIPIRWQSEISVWEPPERFVDRQTKGPYSLWIHEHTFREKKDGTLVGDSVEYAVPGGIVVNWLVVARDLERIFQYRHQMLQQLFNSQNPNNNARRTR
jgi:ligand-binding SRPBCC domain-containing protein